MTNLCHKDVFSLRAGQNSFRVLLVETCVNTASFAQTGRWSRMDSIPFTRSNFRFLGNPQISREFHQNKNKSKNKCFCFFGLETADAKSKHPPSIVP